MDGQTQFAAGIRSTDDLPHGGASRPEAGGLAFGGIWTATLKLAAIAVFCDGVTTWVDAGVMKISGGFGGNMMGYGVMSFPVALGLYWVLLIYLFSMDSGDSWMVVMLLSVFDRIVTILSSTRLDVICALSDQG